MLEAIVAIISLLVGIGVGWWFHSKSVPAGEAGKISRLEGELQSARQAEVAASTNLVNAQNKFEEEKKRLEEIRAGLENTFKAMAADIANTNAATFLKQANVQFKSLKESSEKDLEGKKKLIDKSLSGMNEKLEFIHKQSTALKSSIDTNQKTTEVLSENTTRLREILSSSQKRGQWGERMVGDILQLIGLKEKLNYTKQSQVESGQRPDFTFLLPQEEKVEYGREVSPRALRELSLRRKRRDSGTGKGRLSEGGETTHRFRLQPGIHQSRRRNVGVCDAVYTQ